MQSGISDGRDAIERVKLLIRRRSAHKRRVPSLTRTKEIKDDFSLVVGSIAPAASSFSLSALTIARLEEPGHFTVASVRQALFSVSLQDILPFTAPR